MARDTSFPGAYPAASIALSRASKASRLVSNGGANPPSSPTLMDDGPIPFLRTCLRA